ncbi:hypothetical protein [Sphingobacterium sp. 2149]|nr:hypothetical protein [Sphingobacterium sp. 2149]MDR6736934.1 hypothetical protein [Sphingobacterium sp. 2149]
MHKTEIIMHFYAKVMLDIGLDAPRQHSLSEHKKALSTNIDKA